MTDEFLKTWAKDVADHGGSYQYEPATLVEVGAHVEKLLALADSLTERAAAQADLLSKTAELRKALAPVVEWVEWTERWHTSRQPDDAVIAIGARTDPKYVLRLCHMRQIAALAGELGPVPPGEMP